MRLATIIGAGQPRAAVVSDDRVLFLDLDGLTSVRAIARGGAAALSRVGQWIERQPADAGHPLESVTFGPVVPDPGAIYTVGLNYGSGADDDERPPRPLIYGKAASSVAGHGALLAWDRSLTDNVDAECELGVIIGADAFAVDAATVLGHVLGYTIINDVSSRDVWLDGDQWLLGKSMPGFCPVGPWLVTPDELDPTDLRLGCTINGEAIQDGRTSHMRYSIAEAIAHLSRHVRLRAGDLIATGTPARLVSPPGPGRRLQAGDEVIAWIEGIGELTTTIA